MKKLVLAALLWSGAAFAGESFQDWTVDAEGNVVSAQTKNASGGMLTYTCYIDSQKCIYAISVGLPCDDGAQYLVLVNSSGKGSAHMMECVGDKDGDLLVFQDHETATKAVDHATGVLGIVIPSDQANGTFHAFKFSMRGFVAASKRTAALTVAAEKPGNRIL